MNLSFDQIKCFAKGCIRITEENGALFFDRYTPKQVQAFHTADPSLGERALSTAGIRIDFHTDGQAMTVEIGSLGKYEVLVDDLTVFIQRFESPDCFTIPLGSGNKRVTLVLPSHERGSIRAVSLENASYATACTYAKRLAFYGDSITQGWESEKDSQSYAWLVTRFFDADSLILGVGGARFQPDTVEDVGYDADAVVVALGTNDYGIGLPMETIHHNATDYLDRICSIYTGKKLLCITPIWRDCTGDKHHSGTLQEVRDLITHEASVRGMTVIDGLTLLPHRSEYYADAFLHPNDLGFAIYAQNLVKVLLNQL